MVSNKIIAGILAVSCVVLAGYFTFNKNNTTKTSNKAVQQTTEGDFKVKAAFADVDLDMVIQDKDPKDEDTSGDYLFVTFTCNVGDNKKNDDSNPLNVKAYKLDGNALPQNTKITAKDSKNIVIKLPDGTLKGVNAPHSLEISKNLLDMQGKKVQADLSLKLPYSSSDLSSGNNTKGSSASGSNTNTNSNSTSGNKDGKNTSQSSSDNANADMPKYEIELGKAIPYNTVILVKLDTKEPQNYKVTVDGTELAMKKNSKGETVFINAIKKEYELDQVKKLMKIEKVK